MLPTMWSLQATRDERTHTTENITDTGSKIADMPDFHVVWKSYVAAVDHYDELDDIPGCHILCMRHMSCPSIQFAFPGAINDAPLRMLSLLCYL